MAKMKDVTFYVQVEPVWANYTSHDGERPLAGLRVANTTARRPSKQKGGTALVKLTIRLPEAAFLPLRPEAVIVVPEDMVVTAPIEVEAQPPGEPE